VSAPAGDCHANRASGKIIMSRGGKRVLSYEERVLWSTITKSIAPLPGRAIQDDPAPAEPAASVLPRLRAPATAAKAAPPPAKPKAPPLAPLGRRMRIRVARGREPIDARFDLHGLTQAEAHAALSRFLHAAQDRGAKLVLIITGKGGRSGEMGVLRRQVPHWLAVPELRDLVIGFEDAHTAHGGEGALYVRLRRRRGALDPDL
jgi:DNA-nicking Smr family endonuclease